MCPVRSMGWSNLNVTAESVEGVYVSFQLETSTDGVESESLTCDPGRKATVLAHSDRAFDASGSMQADQVVDKSSNHQRG